MKKMLIVIILIVIINLVLTLYLFINSKCRSLDVVHNRSDTAINHIQIDSIDLIIKQKDSIIINIKNNEKEIINKVNSLSDSASWELFKQLVAE